MYVDDVLDTIEQWILCTQIVKTYYISVKLLNGSIISFKHTSRLTCYKQLTIAMF